MTQAGKVIAVTDTPHTPLPWSLDMADDLHSIVRGRDGEIVARSHAHSLLCGSVGEADANMERIVKCVNGYAELERQLAAATARADAAEKDAARYRWVRTPTTDAAKLVRRLFGEALDAAIDAAQGSKP